LYESFYQEERAKIMHLKDDIKIVEKRKTIRHNCEASIEWSYFNQGVYHEAKLLNFSRSGVFFETASDILLGSTIIIRLGMVLSTEIDAVGHAYPRLVSLGEVTWCTHLSGKHQSCWGVGVRYPFTA